ncbi:MAG: DUF983 domain-containing protein [Hyphomicrobiales bacterium]
MRYPLLTPSQTGMKGKCPRCGQGKLFAGFIKTAERCKRCNLNFTFVDSGDGPAVFVIFIVGFLAVVGVLMTEVTFMPPIWLNMLIWLPLTVMLCMLFLRPLKGLLIAQQYQRKASEGRLNRDDTNISNSDERGDI